MRIASNNLLGNIALGALTLALALLAGVPESHAYTRMFRFQYCTSIPDDGLRLDCYDNYAKEMGMLPQSLAGDLSASQNIIGSWTVRSEVFPEKNQGAVFVFTVAPVLVPNSMGNPSVPSLVARCMDQRTELFVAFGDTVPTVVGHMDRKILYLESASYGVESAKEDDGIIRIDAQPESAPKREVVEIGIGDREPMKVLMSRAKDGEGLFFPNPVSYLRQLKEKELLRLAYAPTGHSTLEVHFDLGSMGEALKLLRDSCGW